MELGAPCAFVLSVKSMRCIDFGGILSWRKRNLFPINANEPQHGNIADADADVDGAEMQIPLNSSEI